MKLRRLELYDWRSYARAAAEFSPGVNLLVGENAQGKTNLLEAVVYLSQGQSFRTRAQAELVRIGAEFADVHAELTGEDRDQSLRAVIFASRRPRQLYVGGVRKKSAADLAGLLPTVLFCPEDLQVLRAGAQARRRLIDHTLGQLRPAYASAVLEYGRCLERKSRILKDHALQPGLVEVLPEYNERMARLGARIIHYRARYVQALDEAARACHGDFSAGKETLCLRYQSVSNIDDVFASEDVLYDRLREHQRVHARAELESGQCLSGPHKDDLIAELNGLAVKSFGSQGQTRTAAISIKLAERELMRRRLGAEPVLLLDDVLSELDAQRQDYVLNRLGDGQVFITCCETDRVTQLGRVYRVENGQITAQEAK